MKFFEKFQTKKEAPSLESERTRRLLLDIAQSGMRDPHLERKTSGEDLNRIRKGLDELRKNMGDAAYKRQLVESREVLRLRLSPGVFESVENFVEAELKRLEEEK